MGSVSNLCSRHTIQTSQSRCWVEVGVMSYLSCLLWKLTAPDNDVAEREHERGVHLVITLALLREWPSRLSHHLMSVVPHLSHNLMSAQWDCWAGPYLSQQPNHAASWQKEEDLCCLHLHLESIQAGLSDVVKTYGQQAILKSWRNLS